MPEAVIVAQYVNQPQAGKKQGSIKTPEGQYYGVPPAMLGMFKPNGTYKVFYESRDYQGKTYHTVKTVSEVMAPPKVEAASGGGGGHQTDRSLEIFVAGAVFHSVDAGHLNLVELDEGDIAIFMKKMQECYRLAFLSTEPMMPRANGPAPKPNYYATGPAPGMEHARGQPMDEEMGDQIPF